MSDMIGPLRLTESPMDRGTHLYHVAGIAPEGDAVTLVPGPQGAEGIGVYWAEGRPRLSAAEGARRHGGPVAIYAIERPTSGVRDWWRTKGAQVRRRGRPRTWHTRGRAIRLIGLRHVGDYAGVPVYLAHSWEWADHYHRRAA